MRAVQVLVVERRRHRDRRAVHRHRAGPVEVAPEPGHPWSSARTATTGAPRAPRPRQRRRAGRGPEVAVAALD
ncbi:MAG TPA: hypothetical protein VF469_09675, partial [Kofleriaceae bacterium]